jgi:predicted kinase
MKAIITIGIPCSGKSTWAEEHCRKTGAVEINRDNIRMNMFNLERYNDYKFSKDKEDKVTDNHRNMINTAAMSGRDIVISDTNLNEKHRSDMIHYLEFMGFEVELKVFDIEFFDALRRNDKRQDKHIPRQVMYDMYRRYMDYKESIGEWKKYEPNEALPSAYIVDIDGTIAHNKNQRWFYDWDRVGEDHPIEETIELTNMLYHAGNKIILMSGRDSVCRKETEDWCDRHGVKHDWLFMRPEGSMEKDRHVKEKMFWKHIAPYYDVRGVFDDRLQVCLLWYDLGIPLFKVGDPIKEF